MKRGAELDEARYIETQQAVYCTHLWAAPNKNFAGGIFTRTKTGMKVALCKGYPSQGLRLA